MESHGRTFLEMQRACGSSIEYCHQDRLILALFYNTGCKVSELVGLRICDFSGIQTKDTASVLFHGKGRKDRRTAIWESTAKLVRQYMQKESLSNGDFLFRSRNGSPITRSGVAQRIGLLASLCFEKHRIPLVKTGAPTYLQTYLCNEYDTVWGRHRDSGDDPWT